MTWSKAVTQKWWRWTRFNKYLKIKAKELGDYVAGLYMRFKTRNICYQEWFHIFWIGYQEKDIDISKKM